MADVLECPAVREDALISDPRVLEPAAPDFTPGPSFTPAPGQRALASGDPAVQAMEASADEIDRYRQLLRMQEGLQWQDRMASAFEGLLAQWTVDDLLALNKAPLDTILRNPDELRFAGSISLDSRHPNVVPGLDVPGDRR